MASIFNGLNIGYSGLSAAQLGINTTGHNISNAETDGYTRQRVVQQSTTPLGSIIPGAQGNGTQVKEIVRIHDEFVYNSYRDASASKEYWDFSRFTLEELSTYFPEIENVGIKYDMQEYFNLWGDLSINPDNQAIKIALAKQTEVLSGDIQQTREQITALQVTLNDQLKTSVDEVNRLSAQIANLNAAITETESIEGQHANDLRDQRGVLEVAVAKLVDASFFEGNLFSNMPADRNVIEKGGDYTMNIAGFNIIDGKSFHPIVVENDESPGGFYKISYERQDGVLIPMDDEIHGGRMGSILDLRGNNFDSDGNLTNGQLQEIMNQLDGFATGLIESTNNLYAQGAQAEMLSDSVSLTPASVLNDSRYNFEIGDFDVVAYDIDGNEAARRTINITATTVMDDTVYNAAGNIVTPGTTNSIIGQLRLPQDDNGDGNVNNDIDSILISQFTYDSLSAQGSFAIKTDEARFAGYTFGVEDNQDNGLASGTNFAGALGLSRFFDGNDAKNIDLAHELEKDPSLIKANKAPIDGDNQLANDMLQLQFEDITFRVNGIEVTDDLYGYYDSIVTDVGTRTNAAITVDETVTAKYQAVLLSYESISKVNIDEELVNLIKYQTAYGAAAKIITTIDQMLDTLLGLKQ
ncbi:MAG: flagellar hook-associated protein FlgK [Arcobacter sp.]|nr:MAG: flagellar hook-associated protein FlgK [Arcobacter sp.]